MRIKNQQKKEETYLNILGRKSNYWIKNVNWIYMKQFKKRKD